MVKYCKNCGNKINEGARFCGKCGTPISNAPVVPQEQANPVATSSKPASPFQPQAARSQSFQSQPAPPPRPQTFQPQMPRSQSAQPQAFQSRSGGMTAAFPGLQGLITVAKKNSTNVLCIVLSILLVVQVIAVALYGWPGFAVGGGTDKNITTTFILQEGQDLVKTDSGVIVDFGPYNSMDGQKVSIKEMPADTESVEDGIRTIYDITAGGRSEFDGLLTITLPYGKGRTDAADEEGSVFAEYFNEDTGQWELVDYTVNTDNSTVTIITDHLSRYCTVAMRDAGSPYAMLSKIGNPLGDETALAILKEFEELGQPGETGYSLLREIYAQLLPSDLIGDDEAELLNDVLGWMADAGDVVAKKLLQGELGLHMVDHVSKLPGKGAGYLQTIKLASKLELFTLGLSTVSLTKTMYDAYKGKESAEGVAAKAYKLAYDAAMTWLDFKEITTGAMQMSMLGVIAIDYSLNKFMAAADQTYKDALFKVVTAYNEEVHPRTDAEWYAMILKLYQNHGDNPKRFQRGLDGLMYNFSVRYFLDNPEEQQVATNAAGLHAYTTGILPETEAAKEYCAEQYMARLGQRLQPVLEDVFLKIRYDAGKGFRANRNELRNAFNAPLYLEIREEIPEGKKSQYAGSVVALTRPGGNISKGWMAVLDKEGCFTVEATILGYIQAGVPTQLRLWLKGDDPSEDKPALTLEFKVTEKVTLIPLIGSEKEDISAVLPGTLYIESGLYGGSKKDGTYHGTVSVNTSPDGSFSFRVPKYSCDIPVNPGSRTFIMGEVPIKGKAYVYTKDDRKKILDNEGDAIYPFEVPFSPNYDEDDLVLYGYLDNIQKPFTSTMVDKWNGGQRIQEQTIKYVDGGTMLAYRKEGKTYFMFTMHVHITENETTQYDNKNDPETDRSEWTGSNTIILVGDSN